MKKNPTIRDLAHELGVSHRAVSQALNPRESTVRISAKTAKKIRRLAEKKNYRPNIAAQALRAERFFNIGYLEARPSDMSYPIFGADVGMFHGASRHGYNITAIHLPLKTVDEGRSVPHIFQQSNLDALVISDAGSLSNSVEKAIDRLGLPIVYLNEKKTHNSVYVDDENGARCMTRHLIRQGYRRILFLRRAGENHYSVSDRLAGYLQETSLAGLEGLVSEIHMDAEIPNAYRANRPDAIFCSNSLLAAWLFRSFYSPQIRIPQDVALAAYGWDWFVTEAPVPLTTMRIPFLDMAMAAAEMAIELAKDKGKAIPSVSFEAEFLEARSTPRKT